MGQSGLGARVGRHNGTTPDPNSLRQAKRSAEWTRVPRNIRDGKDTPEWPRFVDDPNVPELEFWVELWKRPQAALWERDNMHPTVAMFCRAYISSMARDAAITERTVAHRLADALLLTTPALLGARVLIVDPETEETLQTASVSAIREAGRAANKSVKGRFTVVNPSPDEPIEDENESVSGND